MQQINTQEKKDIGNHVNEKESEENYLIPQWQTEE